MYSCSAVTRLSGAMAIAVALAGCAEKPTAPPLAAAISAADQNDNVGTSEVQCASDNAGLTLPAGFCAVVFADLVVDGRPAAARHMAVTPNGDVFVAINSPQNRNPSTGIIGLRDNDGDGRADEQSAFSAGLGGSGLAWHDGSLYLGANDRVVRYSMPSGQLVPTGTEQVIVSGLPSTGDHISKTIVIGEDHSLYVNIGSATNACQVQNRVAQSPGMYPCPELSARAGVWKFDARRLNQRQGNLSRYARGYRNMVAIDLNPRTGELWGVQHGRDMLFENWPQFYTQQDDAVLPAEELVEITRGSDNGWPYCYYNALSMGQKVLAPEYGGNGQLTDGSQGVQCGAANQPSVSFGAHWAPNGLHFYTGSQFPQRYRSGAFVAFHGGFDRAPLPNEGYQVQFVPFNNMGTGAVSTEPFADGFAGSSGPLPATALHRPVGVTEGPDGSLYISDDRGGRIYRIFYLNQ